MKKNLSMILAIILIAGILLTACAPKAAEPTDAPAATEASAAAAPAEDTEVSMAPAKPGALSAAACGS